MITDTSAPTNSAANAGPQQQPLKDEELQYAEQCSDIVVRNSNP